MLIWARKHEVIPSRDDGGVGGECFVYYGDFGGRGDFGGNLPSQIVCRCLIGAAPLRRVGAS